MTDLIYILGVAAGVIITLAAEIIALFAALVMIILKRKGKRCTKKH